MFFFTSQSSTSSSWAWAVVVVAVFFLFSTSPILSMMPAVEDVVDSIQVSTAGDNQLNVLVPGLNNILITFRATRVWAT
jgi:hypothetical protein